MIFKNTEIYVFIILVDLFFLYSYDYRPSIFRYLGVQFVYQQEIEHTTHKAKDIFLPFYFQILI